MPMKPDWDTEQELARAAAGSVAARQALLEHYRHRLRQAIDLRLDRRLRARLDPSDIVQEVLGQADRKLTKYLRDRPLPFYPWLRQLAGERLIHHHRRHVRAQRRSVRREEVPGLMLSEDSALLLADRLLISDDTLSADLRREEWRMRLEQALAKLPARDCEVLVLRFLEDMSTRDIAAFLGISESAIKMRQLRALRRLRDLLGDNAEDDL